MNEQEYKKLGFGQPALWIDFLNSLEHDGLGNTVDHLQNPVWRKTFQHYWKLSALRHEPFPFQSLERLRKLLRKIADNLASNFRLRPNDLRGLNNALNVLAKPQLIQHQNGLALEEVPHQKNWRWIEAQIAQSCAKTLVNYPLDRLKICPDPLCRWLFYDQTKAKSRRWCNEKTCGNRNRVRRSRARVI